jgi:hypothetical protein
MKIEFVDYGIANNFGNRIELNRNLIWHPSLLHRILKHELSHSKGNYSIKDLILDLTSNHSELDKISSWEIFKFSLENPKAFIQLSPIYPSKGKWYWDISRLICYSPILLVLIGIIILQF